MTILTLKLLTDVQRESIFKLWNNEYPRNLQYKSISEFDEYLNGLLDVKHYLLIEGKILVGWAATFERNEEKWFAVIIDSSIQRNGYGTALLNEIKKEERSLVGWVIDYKGNVKANGEEYRSPLAFYIKNKFKILENNRTEFDEISAVKIEWGKL